MTSIKNKVLLENCYSIAKEFSNPQNVSFLFEKEKLQDWNPLSLSHGYPGLIMLFSELDRFFPEKKWDYVTHEYMKLLKKFVENGGAHADPSLFNGFSGINYAVHLASKNGSRYLSVMEEFDKHLYILGKEFLINSNNNQKYLNYGTFETDYDLVTGITGIGVYALRSKNHNLQMLLKDILWNLVKLTLNKEVNGKQIPSYLSAPEGIVVEEDKKAYPNGYLNLGMAHGIAGPLALLSLSYLKGVRVDKQIDAIQKLSKNISRFFSEDGKGSYIQRMVSLEDIEYGMVTDKGYRFDAWCYGGLGVVRALSLAYEATRDKEIEEQTIKLLKGILTSSIDDWNIHSPILCHGYAGNLQSINRLLESEIVKKNYQLEKDLYIKREELLSRINSCFDTSYMYGFKDRVGPENTFEAKIGFLEGVVGIILAVISSHSKVPAKWDGALLLS